MMKTINVKTLFGTAFLLSTLFSGAVIAAAADGEGEKWGELARVTPRKKIEALRAHLTTKLNSDKDLEALLLRKSYMPVYTPLIPNLLNRI